MHYSCYVEKSDKGSVPLNLLYGEEISLILREPDKSGAMPDKKYERECGLHPSYLRGPIAASLIRYPEKP